MYFVRAGPEAGRTEIPSFAPIASDDHGVAARDKERLGSEEPVKFFRLRQKFQIALVPASTMRLKAKGQNQIGVIAESSLNRTLSDIEEIDVPVL